MQYYVFYFSYLLLTNIYIPFWSIYYEKTPNQTDESKTEIKSNYQNRRVEHTDNNNTGFYVFFITDTKKETSFPSSREFFHKMLWNVKEKEEEMLKFCLFYNKILFQVESS